MFPQRVMAILLQEENTSLSKPPRSRWRRGGFLILDYPQGNVPYATSGLRESLKIGELTGLETAFYEPFSERGNDTSEDASHSK